VDANGNGVITKKEMQKFLRAEIKELNLAKRNKPAVID